MIIAIAALLIAVGFIVTQPSKDAQQDSKIAVLSGNSKTLIETGVCHIRNDTGWMSNVLVGYKLYQYTNTTITVQFQNVSFTPRVFSFVSPPPCPNPNNFIWYTDLIFGGCTTDPSGTNLTRNIFNLKQLTDITYNFPQSGKNKFIAANNTQFELSGPNYDRTQGLCFPSTYTITEEVYFAPVFTTAFFTRMMLNNITTNVTITSPIELFFGYAVNLN